MSASIKTLMVTLTLLMLPGLAAFSQMGIRYGIQHEKVTKSTTGSTLNMVLGWDFDLNHRMSGGLGQILTGELFVVPRQAGA